MRKGGILLHISSLPSEYGIGKMGESAYFFADFLADSGIQVWQVLPLSPTSYGDSPYQSFSAYAGNPYFIDFELLEKGGCLMHGDYQGFMWGIDPARVDYECVNRNTFQILRTAFSRFDQNNAAYRRFRKSQAAWLEEYALFMALKDAHGGKPWYQWETPLIKRDPEAIQEAKIQYAEDVTFYSVVQFWFFQQWGILKKYCNRRGISIMGDIPIYVAYDSVEVWAHPELFQLNEFGRPKAVAGCPPDVFSPNGQLWGNPLYDWAGHQKECFRWWIDRLAYATSIYDTVRIDHFRGFESYYAIPYKSRTAERGYWEAGPGMKLFQEVKEKLGDLPIVAEDLGFLTPEVRQMLQECGFPGMKVIQFAFDTDGKNEYLPQNYTTTHCVAYTGTHDNMTLRGWIELAPTETLTFAKHYLHCRRVSDLPSEMLRCAWCSVAELAVAQMQDYLESGPEGRMNTPSTLGNNWQFRTFAGDFTPRLAKRIYRMNELYNRLPAQDYRSNRLERRKNSSPVTAMGTGRRQRRKKKSDEAL